MDPCVELTPRSIQKQDRIPSDHYDGIPHPVVRWRSWDRADRLCSTAQSTFDTVAGWGKLPHAPDRHKFSQIQRRIRQADFRFRLGPRRENGSLIGRRRPPAFRAVNAAEHDEDDEYDDEDDDDDDDSFTFLQWQMPSTPLNAEPVSDDDEEFQLQTITSGNVPALFLGKAYTNAAVNIIGMHKMQKLLEDMYYHLVAPRQDQEAINTIGLLLRAFQFMPSAGLKHHHHAHCCQLVH